MADEKKGPQQGSTVHASKTNSPTDSDMLKGEAQPSSADAKPADSAPLQPGGVPETPSTRPPYPTPEQMKEPQYKQAMAEQEEYKAVQKLPADSSKTGLQIINRTPGVVRVEAEVLASPGNWGRDTIVSLMQDDTTTIEVSPDRRVIISAA